MRPSLSLLKAKKPPYHHVSHPAKAPGPSPKAFLLVRQILADRPRHFREILADGATALDPEFDAERQEVMEKMKARGEEPKPPVLSKINPWRVLRVLKGKKGGTQYHPVEYPEGHPFVSANFLKDRVLKTLSGLQLVETKWTPPYPDTFLARHSPSKQAMVWQLVESSAANQRWKAITGGTEEQRSRPMPADYLAQVSRSIPSHRRKESGDKAADGVSEVESTEDALPPNALSHLSKRRSGRRAEKEEARAKFRAELKAADEVAAKAVLKALDA